MSSYQEADPSFAGWDLEGPTYGTAYLIMVIGICCAIGMYLKYDKKLLEEKLPSIFTQFAVFAAASFGFMGIAVHVIAQNKEEGTVTRMMWFADHSEWLFPWTLGLFLNPLASACLLGIGLTWSKKESIVMPVKIVGLVLAIIEVLICFYDVSITNNVATYWGLACAIGGIIASLLGGCKDAMPLVFLIAGYMAILIGYMLVTISPLVCVAHTAGEVVYGPGGRPMVVSMSHHHHCWMYPDDFNQNAAFHALYALGMPLLGLGVLAKKDDKPFKPLKDAADKGCCGCC